MTMIINPSQSVIIITKSTPLSSWQMRRRYLTITRFVLEGAIVINNSWNDQRCRCATISIGITITIFTVDCHQVVKNVWKSRWCCCAMIMVIMINMVIMILTVIITFIMVIIMVIIVTVVIMIIMVIITFIMVIIMVIIVIVVIMVIKKSSIICKNIPIFLALHHTLSFEIGLKKCRHTFKI